MDDDVAAISLNYQFNENVGLTAFWARPYNDNGGYSSRWDTDYDKNYMDNMDMFAVLLPLTFDGVKVTPWVMYAAMGPGMFDNLKDDPGNAWVVPAPAWSPALPAPILWTPTAMLLGWRDRRSDLLGSLPHRLGCELRFRCL